MERIRTLAAAGLATLIVSAPALADVEIYEDLSEWGSVAGDYATLDFTGFEHGEILGDQYADLGATFPDGNEYIWENSSFENDGWGARDVFFDGINMMLDEPRTTFGLYFVGDVEVQLFLDDEPVSGLLGWGSGFYFIGLQSDVPFDRVFITDLSDGAVFVDDIFFGPAIPAPSAAVCLAATLLIGGRRRRPR